MKHRKTFYLYSERLGTFKNIPNMHKLLNITTKSGQDLDTDHTGFKTNEKRLLSIKASSISTADGGLPCHVGNPLIYGFTTFSKILLSHGNSLLHARAQSSSRSRECAIQSRNDVLTQVPKLVD